MADYSFEDLKPKTDAVIASRIRHPTTARILLWLNLMFQDHDEVYTWNLAKFLSVSRQCASVHLEQFVQVGLLQKTTNGSRNAYSPVRNSTKIKLAAWIDDAKGTIGMPVIKKKEGDKK